MLHRIMISPSVFSSLPEEPRSQTLFCNAVNGFLLDLLDNGVVLDVADAERSAVIFFRQLVESWPIKRKQRVRELLKKLEKKNRFVTLRIEHDGFNTDEIFFKNDFCKNSIKILSDDSLTSLVTGQDCCIALHQSSIPNILITDIDNYSDSLLAKYFRAAKTKDFGSGEVTKLEFEQEILVPIFRDAKHIKIFDRYIGRSVIGDRGNNIHIAQYLKEGYRKTLEWMIEIFCRESIYRQERTFEIYTGIDKFQQLTEKDLQDIKSAFQSFQKTVEGRLSIHINFFLKKEKYKENEEDVNSPSLELRHQRYIVTNQVGLSIDRGFDLLLGDSMRDVSVSFIPKTDGIKRDTDKLKDLLIIP